MALFIWKEKFKINLPDIDAQHKIFMGYINQCHEAVSKDRQTMIPPDLIKKLKKYSEIHFSYEERIMNLYGFPELEKHQELHQHFTSEILKLEKTHLAGDTTANLRNALAMMRDWFLNHVLVEDKKIALYL